MTHYKHFRDVSPSDWPYRHFSPREIACKGTGQLLVNDDALRKLDALRTRLGKPIILTSAYRSPEHNGRVGGAKFSKHMQGIAFDVRMDNHDPHEFEDAARLSGFTAFGHYPANGFMHIDTREDPASWGTPFKPTATSWAEEPKRYPETIKEDKAAQGAAAIGAGGLISTLVPSVLPSLGVMGTVAQVITVIALIALVVYALRKR